MGNAFQNTVILVQWATVRTQIGNIFEVLVKVVYEHCGVSFSHTCYYGDGYYSIADAALGYFDKEVENMDTYECTLLVGIPNAPSVYAPTKNPELAKERQMQVLNKMLDQGYITEDEVEKLSKEEYDNGK